MQTAIVFILMLAVLVLVHEFGHFIIAKKSGMQVEEFGFGFPPRIFGVRKGETLYSLNLIPLGGFVKITGEDNSDVENPRSFVNKSFWARLGTLVAGVIMNIVLAAVLLSIGFGIGLPTAFQQGDILPAHAILKSPAVAIIQVSPNTPAEKAGLREGDQVISVDGKSFSNVTDTISYLKSRMGQEVQMRLKRGSEDMSVEVLDRQNAPADQGAIGIALADVGRLSYPWYYAPIAGVKATWQLIVSTVLGFVELLKSKAGVASLGGPVKIASLTGEVAQLGIVYVLQFAAMLSVNLAILNILPFPALDGGRVLFLLIEKVRGRRNNQKVENWANALGFALLLLLIGFITIHDIISLHK